jgi:hypothetical protein
MRKNAQRVVTMMRVRSSKYYVPVRRKCMHMHPRKRTNSCGKSVTVFMPWQARR